MLAIIFSHTTMSFFVKILGGWLQDHAVDRLAQNKQFQALAVKTIDGLEAARAKAAELGKQVADNPEEAAATAREQATSLWAALKADAKRDLDAFIAAQRDPPPPSSGGGGGDVGGPPPGSKSRGGGLR